jgi:hypothetical protein
MEKQPMHKILTAVAALGLFALPLQATAQTTKQPAATKESTANTTTSENKAATAKTSKAARASKSAVKPEARTTKNKRFAKHGHKMRYARTGHGKRFAKSHRRHATYAFASAKGLPRHHRYHHRVAYGRGCR